MAESIASPRGSGIAGAEMRFPTRWVGAGTTGSSNRITSTGWGFLVRGYKWTKATTAANAIPTSIKITASRARRRIMSECRNRIKLGSEGVKYMIPLLTVMSRPPRRRRRYRLRNRRESCKMHVHAKLTSVSREWKSLSTVQLSRTSPVMNTVRNL